MAVGHGQGADSQDAGGQPSGPVSPFDDRLGTRLVEASGERVVARLAVTPDHHQPSGVVHGGVYATVIETVASVGATLALAGDGEARGISNHTELLRAVSDGELTFSARRAQGGRTLQLWTVDVTDERGRLVAHGTLRLFNRRER